MENFLRMLNLAYWQLKEENVEVLSAFRLQRRAKYGPLPVLPYYFWTSPKTAYDIEQTLIQKVILNQRKERNERIIREHLNTTQQSGA